MHLQGYCVLMVQYIYISAQERDDAGIAGVLMGGGNSYSSGPFQLWSGSYCDGKLSLLSTKPTHFWQVIVTIDNGLGYNKASELAFGECGVLL